MSDNKFAAPSSGLTIKCAGCGGEAFSMKDGSCINCSPVKPTVSEEARERAREVLRDLLNDDLLLPGCSLGDAVSRIIDALGYTPAPVPPPVVDRNIDFIDLSPKELRGLATVVEDFERLHSSLSLVVDDAAPALNLRVNDGKLSVKVVLGEDCWVLRIGGHDE